MARLEPCGQSNLGTAGLLRGWQVNYDAVHRSWAWSAYNGQESRGGLVPSEELACAAATGELAKMIDESRRRTVRGVQ